MVVKLAQIDQLQNHFLGPGRLGIGRWIQFALESTFNILFHFNLRISHLSSQRIELVFPLPQRPKQNPEGLLLQAGLQSFDFFFRSSRLHSVCEYRVQQFSLSRHHPLHSALRIKLEIPAVVQETIKIDLEQESEIQQMQKIFVLNLDQQLVAEIDLVLTLKARAPHRRRLS